MPGSSGTWRLTPRRWLKAERALPLVLTWDEWAAASDVFAIETTDMLDARRGPPRPGPAER
jgi:hypothetical protein